jgi:hypothetical protein
MAKDILEIILSGLSDNNIRFEDLKRVLTSLGFDCRIKGDHHILSKDGIAEIVNLQPLKDGKSKPYQVKQVRNMILKYKLHREAQDV